MTPREVTHGLLLRRGAAVACLIAAFVVARLAGVAAAGEPARGAVLPFHRVIVPEGRLDEVPLGPHRLVPVPLEEFEAALGEVDPVGPEQGLADGVLYRARPTADGGLEGTLEWDVVAGTRPPELSLGRLPVDRGTVTADDVTTEVTVSARDASGLAAAVSRAGRYTFHWSLRPTGGDGVWNLPLAPAARSIVEITLPAGLVPEVEGRTWARTPRPLDAAPDAAAGAGGVDAAATTTWRIDVGPIGHLALRAVPPRDTTVAMTCWQSATVGLGEVRLAAVLVPASPWRSRGLVLDADAGIVVERVTVGSGADDDEGTAFRVDGADGGSRLQLLLPDGALGTLQPVTIRAAAPLAATAPKGGDHPPAALPLLWPEPAAWAGGGVRVECESGLALADVEIDGGIVVGDPIAAAWPLPTVVASAPAAAVATLHVEAQGPGAEVRVEVMPDTPELDIARVTTVEVTTAGVVGRAVCDLRVRRGSAFDIVGRIAEGWFIDAVEAFERLGEDDAPAPAVSEPTEWRVVRDARGAMLRVGLPTAATPSRGLSLRIVGHRAGVDTDVPFPCREMDMIRLEGEAEGAAALALVSAPETTIDSAAEARPPADAPPRLAALLPAAAIRAWIPNDSVALAATAVLLERRAAVEGTTRVVLTARDDRVSQAFTFACRPGAAALDAMIVHFSEPTDDRLEWTLLPPADSSLAVRRLESPAGRETTGESWLVEFQPPLRAEAGLRATRTVPFTAALAVPLAWIEGSGREDGRVAVVNAGRRRPWILNHRLEELPPVTAPADETPAKGTLAEFAYASGAVGGGPAAEILPGRRDRDEDARAWAWREETTCWCHPSGSTEYETRFDIENHGRSRVSLTLPPTAVARGVVIDGVTVSSIGDSRGGTLVVDLPVDRRFVRLAVRAESAFDVGRGLWRVGLATTGIDMPVLERAWDVLLPDGVELLSASGGITEVASRTPGWLERLLPVNVRGREALTAGTAPPRGRRATIDAGFRERSFVQAVSSGDARIVLVQSRWLWGATLLICLTLVTFGVTVRRRMVRLAVAVAMAVAALWIPAPLDGLARAGLWGLAAAVIVRWALGQWRLARGLAILGTALTALSGAADARAPGPSAVAQTPPEGSWPVYIVPSTALPGEADDPSAGRRRTALVPEPLLETLSQASGRRAGAGVRVVATRLDADPASPSWRLAIDVDVDAGSLLTLRQTGDATFAPGGPTVDGVVVRPTADSGPRLLRVGFGAAGRHRVEVTLSAVPVRAGDVASVLVSLPPAPRADVAVAGATGRGTPSTVQVDVPDESGHPRLADTVERAGAGATFDAGRAAWVRVVWSSDGRTPLADGVPAVETSHLLSWRDGDGTLAAGFRVDGMNQIVRGVVVRADPRLAPVTVADTGLTVVALGGGRTWVAPVAPRRGKWGFDATFSLTLADPVGSFDVPAAWLEATVADTRSVQVVAAADLLVRATPPDDAVPLPPRPDGPVAAWRVEAGRAARPAEGEPKGAAAPAAGKRSGGTGGGRLVVERRRTVPRGSQRVDLEFARDQVRVRLRARIDAVGSALVALPLEIPAAGDVERVTLREQAGAAEADVGGIGVDLRWHRAAPDRIVAVLQRPRAGSFTLETVVTVPGAPAPRGTLPLVRALLEQGGPNTVTWTVPVGSGLRVEEGEATAGSADERSGPPAATTGSLDVAADAPPPAYRLVEEELRPVDGPSRREGDSGEPAPPPVAAGGDAEGATIEPRVELAETRLAIDGKGRVWGVSHFDLVAGLPRVRLRLPAGMRLFEVFVDGRVANDAMPARDDGAGAAEAWDLRLLDVGWPRSVVAVFAGDLPAVLPVGRATHVETPVIEGLPCRRRAWVIEVPEGLVVRPRPPARVVDSSLVAEERIAAIDRLATVFDAAIARASPADARRLEDFRDERRREAARIVPPAWEQAGIRAGRSGAAWASPVSIVDTDTASAERGTTSLGLTLVRRADDSLAGRTWATVALLAGWVVLFEVRRRTPLVSRVASALMSTRWAAPAAALVLGGAWAGSLDPAWPGWLAMAVGGIALAAWALRPRGFGPRRAAAGTPIVEGATVAARPDAVPGSAATRSWQAGKDGPTGSTIRR